MRLSRQWILAALAALAGAPVGRALADGFVDAPERWEIGLRPAASPVADNVHSFNVFLTVIIVLITAFVLALLLYVIWRFNEKRNPTPSRTSHNGLLEVAWTVLPVVILVAIAIPSFRLLYFADRTPNAEMTIKAIGHQWYWSYEYPDNGNFTFDANLVDKKDLKKDQIWLLDTDNRLVLPVDTNIRLLVTATDVIHSWAMPPFAVKLDGEPGRVNETWFRITKEGTFYGQCSEICGIRHAYMPITIEAVSKDKFKAWAAQAKTKFAAVDQPAPSPPAPSSPAANPPAAGQPTRAQAPAN
jgi:cytochrome c oxidase subunit 2